MPAITPKEHLLHKTFFDTNRTTHSPKAAQQVTHKSHLQYKCTQGIQILHPSLPSKMCNIHLQARPSGYHGCF